MGKLELQNFRILMGRKPAIVAINKEECQGLKEARDRYFSMVEYAEKGLCVFESEDEWGAHDDAYIFKVFKDVGIIDFDLVDLEVEEEQKRQKEFSKLLAKAREWFKTLPEDQQEMVNALVDSNSFYPACG